ncbi:HAMP domain-containing sensor histidine kinase [Bacilliculturomica massiliensis]|uniref:HAMP domain-containing sensor histidine kinase n=1 Tax=Bacilliculturomica massiliensis TaxID=1917867 RepID=UPI001030CA5E|nr:HAMP domain-containing sensor histidine kinase [Bacilliculturomica massiliensis]
MFKCRDLKVKMIFAMIVSLTMALAVFWAARYCGDLVIESRYNDFYEEESKWIRGTLVSEEHNGELDLNDEKERQKWLDEHSENVGIALYDEYGWYVASTSLEQMEKLYSDLNGRSSIENVYSSQLVKEYPLPTDDGIWILVLYGYVSKTVVRAAALIELLIAVAVFFLVFHLCTRKKMKDFFLLEKEIRRMQSGDLEHAISLSGDDQLSSLAENLDQLRLALSEQIESEQEARKANSELITAMSHDLRTPLTVLIGYLQIINTHRYKTPEQREKYLLLAEKKACQIRQLSDRLFEYSLVFGTDELLQLEETDGRAYLDRVLEERTPELSSGGFCVIYDRDSLPPSPWFLTLNSQAMVRVWDNLFSNVLRHGDPSRPLHLAFSCSETQLRIRISNAVRKEHVPESGSGVGLKSCRRLLEKQQGEFSTETSDGDFTAELGLPYRRP